MKRVKIRETGPLALEMTFSHSRRKTERLAITDPFYPRTELAIELFRSLGTMELVSPYLPETIDTDFAINADLSQLICGMYGSCQHPTPSFTEPHWDRPFKNLSSLSNRVIVSHSAGKDSLHSVMWGQDQWGAENVMPVHISGLNTSNAAGERQYSYRQREHLGWPRFREVRLKSSAKCTKNRYEVMRSRDFFMTGILIPVALEFGAHRILTEGFEEAYEHDPYTGQQGNMEYFNGVLERLGIPVQVAWKNLPEMQVIREVYQKRPGWMEHVHNCFSIACRKDQRRDSWIGSKKKKKKGRTPSWPLYDSQCGSCPKCRITRLGQLMYDFENMAGVKEEEIQSFLKDTAQYTVKQWKDWVRGEMNHRDMLGGSFLIDLDTCLRVYGLESLGAKTQKEIEFLERNSKAA